MKSLAIKNKERVWKGYSKILETQGNQLEKLTATALSTDHNVGWNVTIINPDLDPDSRFAKGIIQYLASVIRVFG